jgi:hypothetical protein
MAAKVQGTWMALGNTGISPDGTVGTTKLYPLGFRVKARDMGTTDYGEGEFIYLQGVANTAAGSVAVISTSYTTALVAARTIGPLAVALGANVANNYGWYQIAGKGVALCDAGVTDGAALYIDGTSGRIDDTVVAGDAVVGMRAASTDDTNTCLVVMNYPATADFDNA